MRIWRRVLGAREQTLSLIALLYSLLLHADSSCPATRTARATYLRAHNDLGLDSGRESRTRLCRPRRFQRRESRQRRQHKPASLRRGPPRGRRRTCRRQLRRGRRAVRAGAGAHLRLGRPSRYTRNVLSSLLNFQPCIRARGRDACCRGMRAIISSRVYLSVGRAPRSFRPKRSRLTMLSFESSTWRVAVGCMRTACPCARQKGRECPVAACSRADRLAAS